MFEKAKEVLDKGMPVSEYVKKKYDFGSVEDFERYIEELREKAAKFDEMTQDRGNLN